MPFFYTFAFSAYTSVIFFYANLSLILMYAHVIILGVNIEYLISKLRVPWTARRSNRCILKEISPGVHWKD